MKVTSKIYENITDREDFEYTHKTVNGATTVLIWEFTYEVKNNKCFEYIQTWVGPTVKNDELIDWQNGTWGYSISIGDKIKLKGVKNEF